MADTYGLYIHIPYCESKCFYCDFSSYTGRTDTVSRYIDVCINEMKSYEGAALDTVYLGGGTPSFIYPKEIERLLNFVHRNFSVREGSEITIECNPNSVDREKLRIYGENGINRLSIGLQTTDEEMLKRIGRLHSFQDFLNCIEISKKEGFDNLSADFMYALPGQELFHVEKDMENIKDLGIRHISAYELRLERGTPLFGAEQPDEDTNREMFSLICNKLSEIGLERYEISNFAVPGFESRHNLKYWNIDEGYIGIGAAAHSFMNKKRYANTANLDEYIRLITEGKSAVVAEEESDYREELVMLSLRTKKGLDLNLLGLDFKNPLIIKLLQNGLAEVKENTLVLTDRGMDVHNSVVISILEELDA